MNFIVNFLVHFVITITVQGALAIDFGIKHEAIADLVNSYNKPTIVLLYGCAEKKFELSLAKQLNQKKAIQFLLDVKSIRRHDLMDNGKNILFIADLKCSGVKTILEQSIALNLFRAPYRWLLLDSPDEHHNVSSLVADLFLPTDSEVALVRETASNYFKINLIYKISADDKWRMEPFGHWNLTHRLQESGQLARAKAVRRQNLHGHVVGVGWVVHANQSLTQIINKEDPHLDRITKANIVTGSFVIDFINASQKYMLTKSWGFQKNYTWNGLSGLLASAEADLGGSPMFFTPERYAFSQYIAPSRTRMAFVFQQPPLSYTSNIFLLSFQNALWYGSAILLCILFCVLCATTVWEWKKKGISNGSCDGNDTLRANVSDVGMLVVGATCQQGSTVELKGPSGRIVLMLLFVALTFLYTSFCANIVALLQSSSSQIKTLQDLLDSKMKFGVEDFIWAKRYFMMEKEPIRKALYEKKIAPHGEIQNFFRLEKGVKEMKKGQFAFYMELGVGYRAVGKYLEEHEKCNLEEIPYIQQLEPHIAARKDSPFVEMFRIGYARIQEHGLQNRENLLMYTNKPKCSGSQSSFLSVSLVDCSPAFLVIAYGTLIAVLVCIFENVYYRVKIRYCHVM